MRISTLLKIFIVGSVLLAPINLVAMLLTEFNVRSLVITTAAVAVVVIGFGYVLRRLGPINDLIRLVKEVKGGNINVNIDRSVLTKNEIGTLTGDVYDLVDTISSLVNDAVKICRASEKGQLLTRGDEAAYQGSFRELVASINQIVKNSATYLDNIDVGIEIFDTDYNFTYTNKRNRDQGYSFEKTIGKSFLSVYDPDLAKEAKSGFDRVKITGNTSESVYNSVTPSGLKLVEHYRYIPVKNAMGEILALMLVANDITSITTAQTELDEKAKEFEEKAHWYESILDAIPMPLSITDLDMNWTFINRATENYLGKKRSEVVGQHCSNWGATICNTEKCGIRCMKNGKPETMFGNGDMTFKVDVAYLTDTNQKRAGHIEVVQDITELLKTQRELPKLVDNVRRISSSFKQASTQILDGSKTLAESTLEQSATVQQLLASAADVAEKAKANAGMAGKTANLAVTIKNSAEKGNRQMDEMVAAVDEISRASQSISNVIKVINDIAFQTNMLALNASVEASRAGQHGKGFAVVAEEVRSLAAKSAEAAKDTGALISNSMEKAQRGAGIAKETAGSLALIVSGISESSGLISEIATASEAQSISIAQINSGIDQVAKAVQQTSATADESATSSRELNEQAESLEQMIGQFFHVLRRASDRNPNAVSIPPNGIERRSL